jgi:hypothetical protein
MSFLTKAGRYEQSLVFLPEIRFRENTFICALIFSCGQTDKHDEGSSLQMYFANTPEKACCNETRFRGRDNLRLCPVGYDNVFVKISEKSVLNQTYYRTAWCRPITQRNTISSFLFCLFEYSPLLWLFWESTCLFLWFHCNGYEKSQFCDGYEKPNFRNLHLYTLSEFVDLYVASYARLSATGQSAFAVPSATSRRRNATRPPVCPVPGDSALVFNLRVLANRKNRQGSTSCTWASIM